MPRYVDEYQTVDVADNSREPEVEDTNPLLDDDSSEKGKKTAGKAMSTDSRSTVYQGELEPDLRQWNRVPAHVRWTKWLALIEGGLLIALVTYIVLTHSTQKERYPGSLYGPLGTDWNGFVPETG